jgi:type IV secretory pathway TrbL component
MLAQLVIKLKRAESSRAELTMSRASSRATSILSSPNPDYGQLGKVAEGQKRKRVASALDKEGTKLAKKDKEISEKRKLSPEPKIAAPKKRKAASPKPKTSGQEEEAPGND